MVDYCTFCKHCHTEVVKTHRCRLNGVERLTSSTCCWDTKKYPSKFESQVPITTNILTYRQQFLMEVVQKVQELISEDVRGWEAERILTFLKEMK
jgi:hypothetical protein